MVDRGFYVLGLVFAVALSNCGGKDTPPAVDAGGASGAAATSYGGVSYGGAPILAHAPSTDAPGAWSVYAAGTSSSPLPSGWNASFGGSSAAGSTGGASVGSGGASSSAYPSCADFSEETGFALFSAQGHLLGRPYGAWAESEQSIHVALGVEDGTFPSSTRVAAVAHSNSSGWFLDQLPPSGQIGAISGTSANDLWLLSNAVGETAHIFRNRTGRWEAVSLPPPFKAALGLVVLGPDQAIVSARPDYNLITPGVLLEASGNGWSQMLLSAENQPYTIMQLSAVGPNQVYGLGYATGPLMGTLVLDVFDGMSWTSSVSPGTDLSNPRAPATNFFQSIAVTPDFIYALMMTPNPQGGRIYKTKANGQPAWVSVADLQGFAIGGSLVVTATGTVVAVWPGQGSTTVVELRGDSASYCSLPAFGSVSVVAPPGSRNVHVFAGSQREQGQGTHHWLGHIDP